MQARRLRCDTVPHQDQGIRNRYKLFRLECGLNVL